MTAVREQYLRAWERVLVVADGVEAVGWDAPSPCAGRTAGHVAGHLVDAARQTSALLAGAPQVRPTTDPADLLALVTGDPAAQLREAADSVTSLVHDLESAVATPHGELPAEQLVSMALVEPVVHGWDLAVAVGATARMDDDAVATLLTTAEAMGPQLAASGMYASALPLPATADPQARLLALLGRRPVGGDDPDRSR